MENYPIYKYHLGTRRSSATVLGKAYAVGDIAWRIPLHSNGPLLVIIIEQEKLKEEMLRN